MRITVSDDNDTVINTYDISVDDVAIGAADGAIVSALQEFSLFECERCECWCKDERMIEAITTNANSLIFLCDTCYHAEHAKGMVRTVEPIEEFTLEDVQTSVHIDSERYLVQCDTNGVVRQVAVYIRAKQKYTEFFEINKQQPVSGTVPMHTVGQIQQCLNHQREMASRKRQSEQDALVALGITPPTLEAIEKFGTSE